MQACRNLTHADFFWAKCLAESAAQQQPVHGLIEYWKQEAEKLRAAACSAPRTSAEIARELGRAQIKYAQDIGCFGAEKWPVIQQLPVVKPPVIALTACPNCGNKALSRYLEFVRCNPCGWKSNV